LREALGQLAGLKRRKMALEMLGKAVQNGLNKKLSESSTTESEEGANKRQRTSDDGDEKGEDTAEEPATKKSRTEPEATTA
jgi:hypothetical protein